MTRNNKKEKHSSSEDKSWFIAELQRELEMIKGWFKKDTKPEKSPVSRDSRKPDQNTDKSHTHSKHKKNKKHVKESAKIKPVYKIILSALIFLLIGAVAGLMMLMNSMQYKAPETANDALAIEEYEQNEVSKDAEIIDAYEEIEVTELSQLDTDASELEGAKLRYILLIGLDARESGNWSNASTDVMKVVALDESNNTIKILSFMRDILIPIDGHTGIDGEQKYGKLNSVYFFNGPDGLCSTLQKYFGIPVDEYIIINWEGTTKFIDKLGGVEVNIKNYELEEVNKKIKYQNKFKNIEYASELYKPGKQTLNGNQALAYMRVRKAGHGDYERVERQVVVLRSVINSLKSASLKDILSLTTILQEVVNTNIKPAKMIDYATMGYGMLEAEMSSMTIPYGDENETHTAGRYEGKYVLDLDFDANYRIIEEYLAVK